VASGLIQRCHNYSIVEKLTSSACAAKVNSLKINEFGNIPSGFFAEEIPDMIREARNHASVGGGEISGASKTSDFMCFCQYSHVPLFNGDGSQTQVDWKCSGVVG
jgi:hypothetical protein